MRDFKISVFVTHIDFVIGAKELFHQIFNTSLISTLYLKCGMFSLYCFRHFCAVHYFSYSDEYIWQKCLFNIYATDNAIFEGYEGYVGWADSSFRLLLLNIWSHNLKNNDNLDISCMTLLWVGKLGWADSRHPREFPASSFGCEVSTLQCTDTLDD